jgi:hypothetical protein
MLAGSVIIALNLTVPHQVGPGLELRVAVMLVTLRLRRLGEIRHGLETADPNHLVAGHEHEHGT